MQLSEMFYQGFFFVHTSKKKKNVSHVVCDVEGELHAAACYPSSCTSDMLLSYKPPDLQYSMEQAGV